MRYILDSSGYIESVSCTPFNCHDKSCTEYKGSIPSGYDTLQEWATTANIRAYKITNNNLVYDVAKDEALQAEWEKQTGHVNIITNNPPVKTNRVIDGKEEYVKRVAVNKNWGDKTTSAKISTGLTNISIVKLEGFLTIGNASIPINWCGNLTNFSSCRYDYGDNTLVSFSNGGWKDSTGHVDIYFTYN